MAFKMNGFSAFTKKTDPPKSSNKPVDANWKADQGLLDDLKSLQQDLKEATTTEQKNKIKKDINSVRNQIEEGFDKDNQLNPKSVSKD